MKGIPEESVTIAISSSTESSLKQYNSSIKKWWLFCKKIGLDIYDTKVADIIKFLTEEFHKGASYGTLNCTRSAISIIVGPEIGQDEILKRFFRGLYKLRPLEPKYDSTWDPSIILDYFANLQNNDLSLEVLSKKIVTLLAVITGQRMQTLSLIDIEDIIVKHDLIEIKIPKRIKTSRPGKNQPVLFLPFYFENNNICPARTLQFYIKKTQHLRNDTKNLFISFKKTFKKVSTQTLSRWVKEVLYECGIDTDIFSAHSTRHGSTSAAKRKGVNIDQIRKSAGWSENSATFARFYDRPILPDVRSFGQAILDV